MSVFKDIRNGNHHPNRYFGMKIVFFRIIEAEPPACPHINPSVPTDIYFLHIIAANRIRHCIRMIIMPHPPRIAFQDNQSVGGCADPQFVILQIKSSDIIFLPVFSSHRILFHLLALQVILI